MTNKLKRRLKRISIAMTVFLIVFITNLILKNGYSERVTYGLASIIQNEKIGWLLPFGLYFIIYLYIGYDVLKKSFINIKNGQVFDENFLMAVATLGAFGLGIYTGLTEFNPEGFDEACAVLLFYQVGEWFQSFAVGKSRKSIAGLMDIRPDFANLKREKGVEVVDPSVVNVGDVIMVKAGEKIPLDGEIVWGNSTLDVKALTGESLPQDVKVGDKVLSGSINLSGVIEIKVSKNFKESTVSKILDLVENATNKKAKAENFISKFSKYYTPIVVFMAVALAIIPPVACVIIGQNGQFNLWLYRALSFLVVSCPCALVISVPLSFFSGIGGASRNGILVKGSSYLEKFNRANIFVFDKTGTLTKGSFNVAQVFPQEKKDEILELSAVAEKNSNHPIALSIKKAYGKEIEQDYQLTEIAGKGVYAKSPSGDEILCGNEKLMIEFNVDYTKATQVGTAVYVAKNGVFVGYIVIKDQIKEDAFDTINYLNMAGAKTVMLTGDGESIASEVANQLKVSEYKASLLPQDKVEQVDKLLCEKREKDVLCFVGDGINDAPVIMKADVGIAMGGVGSDATIEASDIVLMHDDLRSIVKAKKIARKTMRIVFQNVIFALTVKAVILVLSSLGITNMWFAVFGDVGVAVIAILNSMRANVKNIK